jgi:hypothetical protein
MAKVNITVDGKTVSVPTGSNAHLAIVAAAAPTVTNAVPRLRIPALNQIFSRGDNVNINGGEIVTSSLY